MTLLYRAVIPSADLDPTDCLTAELVKTTENAYRDVNIAFANEVALICEAAGGDVWKVRELVNKSPGRNMLLPGAGVGGHCIPKDPWLLASAAGDAVDVQLIPAARAVNESMPLHIAGSTEHALAKQGKSLPDACVLVLGYSYLEDSDDTRHSPSEVLVKQLQALGAKVVIHDPWIKPYDIDLHDAANGMDAIVLMVKHSAYKELDFVRLGSRANTRILIDGRNGIDPEKALNAGFSYSRIGYGKIGRLAMSRLGQKLRNPNLSRLFRHTVVRNWLGLASLQFVSQLMPLIAIPILARVLRPWLGGSAFCAIICCMACHHY